MRRLFALLVCLFSFWAWKDLFVRWLRSRASHPARGETAEHLPSQEGQQESEFARFLSSLPGDGPQCSSLSFNGDSKVQIYFGQSKFTFRHGVGVERRYDEFLEAVASSKVLFSEEVSIDQGGDDCCKHVEAFADAVRQSDNKFRRLDFDCEHGYTVRFAKCLSSVLLGNDAIQHLSLEVDLVEEMDEEGVAEFAAIIAMPHIIRILKSFKIFGGMCKLVGEGMEQLLKPFHGPHSVLEELSYYNLTSNAQLEQISGLLISNTSLKTLRLITSTSLKTLRIYDFSSEAFTSGYKSIAIALCSNQSLEFLVCTIFSSTQLKLLLDPLMPKSNNSQRNTTLTNLGLWGSIGGKEGIETLVDMIHTNTSLLELGLMSVDELSLHDAQGIENALVILEALKTNKSLKKINFYWCQAVGGYKVLEAMIDLLLENYNIEDINL